MKSLVNKYPVVSFVLFAVLPVYLILVPLKLAGVQNESLKPLKLLFALTPLASLAIVLTLSGKSDSFLSIFRKFRFKVKPIWLYAGSIFIFILLAFLGLFSRYLYDGFFPDLNEFSSIGNILLLSLPLFIFPGITEEFAWRGFLQEKLQTRYNATLAAIVVGLVWACWHGMDYLIGNWASEPKLIGLFIYYTITLSIIIAWFYNRSGGNVLIAMMGHFGANVTNYYMPLWKDFGSNLPVIVFLAFLGIICFSLFFLDGKSLGRKPGFQKIS